MDIMTTLIAVALIFLAGVGIGAAITEMMIDKEDDEND